MKHLTFIIACCISSSLFADESPILSSKERVMQLSQQYHQQRRLQEIATDQKEAEARNFAPDVTYDSFTLTEADEIHSPVASRAPAQAQ